MTKIFDIIHLNNEMYMIDKELDLINQWTTDGVLLYEPTPIRKLIMAKAGTEGWLKEKIKAIVATTNKSLDLPLLPAIEEDIEVLVRKSLTKAEQEFLGQSSIDDLVVLYKAAKAKKYTEEDIMTFYKYVKTHTFQEAMDHLNKSTNPLPKQVEVEMEDIGTEHEDCIGTRSGTWEGGTTFTIGQRLLLVNNIVQVKRWIYEK